MVVTDNASNTKHAFKMMVENYDQEDEDKELEAESIEIDTLHQWTPHPLKFEGCAAHQIHLVVNDGYDELKAYRRVQAIFAKAKAISALCRKSSHFAYSLALKIPVPNDTRWNSQFRFHAHILKHCENISESLQKINK